MANTPSSRSVSARHSSCFRTVAALALWLAAVAARAEQATTPSPLPPDPVLDRLVAESLAARPEVRQAEASLNAERERVPQAGALPDPVLSLGIQNDGFGGIQIGKMETSFWQVMLSQGLPWPGKRGLRSDVARLGASQAEAAVTRQRLSTEADVRRAYLDLVLVRERLELLDRLEQIWQTSIGTARARYESGEGAQSDVLRSQLELNRIRQRRWTLRAEEAAALQALNRLRAHPLDEPIATTVRLRDAALPPVPSLETATSDAEARSPELARARLTADQANAQVRLSERERFPDLSVNVGIMPRGGLDPMWTAGVSIGLPIWSGRKQNRAVAESEARSTASARSAETIDQVLRLRVAERRSTLTALADTVKLYREGLLVQSRATAESTLSQYRVGRVSFASVLDANAGYINDEDGHLLAVADALRVAIASAEVSLEPPSAGGASGGMGGAAVPGAGATGGGMGGGGGAAPALAAPAAPTAAPSSSSSGM
ncbi:TolC family protein [Anaeromyxobacter oryzisoli]|uniref:TolC family protein n=1 Tax=Anaeromyxobacter oryzisoli TaxID=2925408 RepID=UPI001F58FFE3|nr:TolC family protein [Anaeromyxobacter sp. SG63]